MKSHHHRPYWIIGSIVVSALVLLSRNSMADFATQGKSQFTASANSTGSGTVAFDVSIHNISDNSIVSNILWSSVTLPSSFVRASTYIQLNSTITAGGGGIQIYTDNTASGASPHFAGSASDNPAGLLDTVSPQLVLPLAWSIKDSLGTVPVAANPNNGVDSNSFQWAYMKDRSYTPNPILYPNRQFAFVAGEDYVTIRKAGLLNGVSGVQFFPATSPDYVYFEADFSTAVTPRSYGTSTLTFEAYTQ